jgi:hypothetical protein
VTTGERHGVECDFFSFFFGTVSYQLPLCKMIETGKITQRFAAK